MMIAGTERRRQGCSLQDGKQWGFTVFDPVDYKNVNFTLPLSVNGTFCAFSTGYDPKGSTFLWHSMSHFNNVNVGVTGFVFDSRYTFTGLGYLAVCWQKQWGFTNNTGRPYITFPFKFSNVFTAISCICHNGSPSEANTVYNVSISGMNIGASGGGSGKYWCAFGVAQQQWGIISNNKAIFPLVFNVFVSSALLLSRGSGTGTWYGDSSNTTLTGISCVTPDYVLSGTYIAIGA